jgi:Protein of unknown function (DUF1394).
MNHVVQMKTPAIQNDFSYYRRTITRQRMSSHNGFEHLDTREVTNELANRMSLFYAHATPMLKVLSEATSMFVQEVSAGLCPLLGSLAVC